MPDGSEVPLSIEQQEFLNRVVTDYRSGVHSPFIFFRSHSGSGVTYAGAQGRAWAPMIDEIDLEQLAQTGLITIRQVAPHQYQGKLTAAAIAAVTASAESPESGAGSIGNAAAVVPVAEGLAVSGIAESRDLNGAARRRRGFPANADDHYKVVEVISKIGADWPSRLAEVCRQLQNVGAVFPKALRRQAFVHTWDEIAEDILGPGNSSLRESVAKHIKYRINWVRRNQAREK